MIPAGPRQIIGRIDRGQPGILVEIPDLHHLVLAAGEQRESRPARQAPHPRVVTAGLDHQDRHPEVPHLVLRPHRPRAEDGDQQSQPGPAWSAVLRVVRAHVCSLVGPCQPPPLATPQACNAPENSAALRWMPRFFWHSRSIMIPSRSTHARWGADVPDRTTRASLSRQSRGWLAEHIRSDPLVPERSGV